MVLINLNRGPVAPHYARPWLWASHVSPRPCCPGHLPYRSCGVRENGPVLLAMALDLPVVAQEG
jgi:hypothetical protein